MGLSAHRQLGGLYESVCFIPSNSYRYLWDAEELRHQEHLRRFLHVCYLYRHRHDSSEAARLYRNFTEEQNQWMEEQERMEEMESRVSARVYQQRASYWEEEWRRLEEGRDIEDILKPQRKGIVTAPFQKGSQDIFREYHSTDGLSGLITGPQSVSSLDLPGPLLPFPGSSSQLHVICSEDTIQQVDGTQQTKTHKLEEGADRLARSQGLEGISISNSRPSEARGYQMELLHSGSKGIRDLENGLISKQTQFPSISRPGSSIVSSGAQNTSLSLCSSHSNQSSEIPSLHEQQKRSRNSSLASGDVIHIISHKPLDEGSFLYLISWRLQNSSTPTVECWVRAMDFFGGSKKAILEDYHLCHNLGAIFWPRDRRQLRTSTSFGVREINSALDKRKQMLLQRGVDEFGASRELNGERWRMRDDWQRTGRGWGSAILIVEGRKKAWEIADSATGKKQPISTLEIKEVSKGSLGENPSDHTATMKASGRINIDDIRYPLGLYLSSPDSSSKVSLSQSENPDASFKPLLNNTSGPNCHGGSKIEDRERRNEFRSTSEDEREWREHFNIGPGISCLHELSTSSKQNIRLSRVKSTLHNLPGAHSFDRMWATTLPEEQKVANLQVSLQSRYKEPRKSRSPVQDAQGYLKAQRKSLLSRMLAHGLSKKECYNLYKTNSSLHAQPRRGTRESLIFVETATRPLESPENRLPGSHSSHSATSRLSSFISFDGAGSGIKTRGMKSWRKALWGKFPYFLVSSRASSPLSGKDEEVAMDQNESGNQTLSPENAETVLEVAYGGSQAKFYRSELEQHSSGSVNNRATISNEEPQDCRFVDQEVRLPLLRPLLVETTASGTASWAASVLSPLYKSKPEEPQKLSLEIDNRAEGPLVHAGHVKAWSMNKGKGKAEVEIDCSLISTNSAPLTRSLSQEEYLIKREAEKQVQRNKTVTRIKMKAKERKEKTDQYAKDLKKLDDLYSKKTCPLSRWKRSDQLELELLRMKLGIRPDKRTSEKDSLKRMTVADLKKMRESFLSTTIATEV